MNAIFHIPQSVCGPVEHSNPSDRHGSAVSRQPGACGMRAPRMCRRLAVVCHHPAFPCTAAHGCVHCSTVD